MTRTLCAASRVAATLCRSARCASSAGTATTTTTTRTISHSSSATATSSTRPPSTRNSLPVLLLPQQQQQRRTFAGGWDQRGYDITAESLDWGERPKVVVEAHAPTGFDVGNTVRKIDQADGNDNNSNNTPVAAASSSSSNEEESDGTVHMNGSVLVFPYGCFLWRVESAADVTVESLAPVVLHRPKLEYLFVGCNRGQGGVPRAEMERIQEEMAGHGIVAEQLNLTNAIGTFNILNAEDRMVACALVIDRTE